MISYQKQTPFFSRLAVNICLYLAFFSPQAFGMPLTLSGDPVDYEGESEKVCCIDIAAVNLLNYLDRQGGNANLIPDGQSVGDQQEDFHKKYDPNFEENSGNIRDLKNGLDATFKDRNFSADVKSFFTPDLTYDALLKEWFDDELIILIGREVGEPLGHALFLWGLETDKTKPRLSVTDVNIHPNTDHKIDGESTNSEGIATWSDLSIGTDANNLPDWRIMLEQPEHIYRIGDITETFPPYSYNLRITGFVSVSDVSEIGVPEPATLALFGIGLAGLGFARKKKKSA